MDILFDVPLEVVFTLRCCMQLPGLLKVNDRAPFQTSVENVIRVAASLVGRAEAPRRLMIQSSMNTFF